MNRLHRMLCSSDRWARLVERQLPAALDGIPLGPDVLEIGPGFGATTRVLLDRVPRLTALEVDESSMARLRTEFAARAEIVQGDGADMPFPDGAFSGVVCFTMLHHVPSAHLQDRLFAEAHRVLRPGGVFTGTDSQPSVPFRVLHIGDTMVVVDPATLPDRLAAAGFTDIDVEHEPKRHVAFRARKPTSP